MAFLSKDVPEIQKMLQDYLWDSISIRDTAARTNQKEHFYHGGGRMENRHAMVEALVFNFTLNERVEAQVKRTAQLELDFAV